MVVTTLNLVDPEQREAVANFLAIDPSRQGLAAFRTGLVEGMGAAMTPEPVEFETRVVARGDGLPDLRLLLHRQEQQQAGLLPAILYFHGGGMIAGTPDMMAGSHKRLARETKAVVVAPQYRLAPETPFPGGLEDCYAALLWLHANAAELGVDPQRIAVMGDSGGGGLAAALTLLARDRGQVKLAAQFLLYPMLDMRTATPEAPFDDPLTGEFVVGREFLRFCWEKVRGGAELDDDRIGYLSPALAKNLRNLPPAVIVTGALDLFRDEDIFYARDLMLAGIPVDLQVYAGAVHGFDMLPGRLSDQARTALFASIGRML